MSTWTPERTEKFKATMRARYAKHNPGARTQASNGHSFDVDALEGQLERAVADAAQVRDSCAAALKASEEKHARLSRMLTAIHFSGGPTEQATQA